jgi:hypothetical protein
MKRWLHFLLIPAAKHFQWLIYGTSNARVKAVFKEGIHFNEHSTQQLKKLKS